MSRNIIGGFPSFLLISTIFLFLVCSKVSSHIIKTPYKNINIHRFNDFRNDDDGEDIIYEDYSDSQDNSKDNTVSMMRLLGYENHHNKLPYKSSDDQRRFHIPYSTLRDDSGVIYEDYSDNQDSEDNSSVTELPNLGKKEKQETHDHSNSLESNNLKEYTVDFRPNTSCGKIMCEKIQSIPTSLPNTIRPRFHTQRTFRSRHGHIARNYKFDAPDPFQMPNLVPFSHSTGQSSGRRRHCNDYKTIFPQETITRENKAAFIVSNLNSIVEDDLRAKECLAPPTCTDDLTPIGKELRCKQKYVYKATKIYIDEHRDKEIIEPVAIADGCKCEMVLKPSHKPSSSEEN